jgi:hypothetical protein
LLALPLNPATRSALLNVLSLCSDADALATARSFAGNDDAAVAAAARDAVDAITSNLAGAPAMTASVDSEAAAQMADGKDGTFWQVPSELGLWIRADLHHPRPVRKLTLEHGNRSWGYPAQFDVQVSDDPEKPGEVIAQGEGERTGTVLNLPAGTRGRYVWLRVTKLRDAPIAISEMIVE